MTTSTNGHNGVHHKADKAIDTLYARHPGATPAPAPPSCPEARCSVNVRLRVHGHEVQVTLRGHEEADVFVRLEAVLAQFPLPEPAKAAVPNARPAAGYCAIHDCEMPQTSKDGHSWFSHRRDDGSWCKGKGR